MAQKGGANGVAQKGGVKGWLDPCNRSEPIGLTFSSGFILVIRGVTVFMQERF